MKKTEVIHIRMEEETKKRIEAEAAKRGRTVSNLIFIIIKKRLEENAGNP